MGSHTGQGFDGLSQDSAAQASAWSVFPGGPRETHGCDLQALLTKCSVTTHSLVDGQSDPFHSVDGPPWGPLTIASHGEPS